jgi:hypothetical protein
VIWHSAKIFFIFKISFAECHIGDTRQRLTYTSLPSATEGALGKAYFAECQPAQHSAKYIFIFFYFVSQTFCGMFLHYVDLHVSFVDNYNRVFNR